MSFASASANADKWDLGPYDLVNDPLTIESVSGMPPFDQTVLEGGLFSVTHHVPDGYEVSSAASTDSSARPT